MTPRVVRPGPRIDGYRVVREGLKGDETIVITGLQRVRPGSEGDAASAGAAAGRAPTSTAPRRDKAMKFAHFFVDRPIFASVLSIVFVHRRAASPMPGCRWRSTPRSRPPTIVVRASYPGANAETVAATVATPLEQEINGVEDMLYMSS